MQEPLYALVEVGLVGVAADEVSDDTIQNGFLEIYVLRVPAFEGAAITVYFKIPGFPDSFGVSGVISVGGS